MTEEIKKLIESVKVYQHPVPLCFDSIARALVDKSDFDKVVKELEYLSELRKPSEDIKQAIEEAAEKYQEDVYSDVYEESSLSEQKLECILDFKAGAEFALKLSENAEKVLSSISYNPQSGNLEINLSFMSDGSILYGKGNLSENSGQVDEPSSRSQENGDELLEAAKQILDLHVCEMEGLSSGQPTPTEWMNAVDKLSEAISNYEKQSK